MNIVLKSQSIIKCFIILRKEEIVDFRLDIDNHQNIYVWYQKEKFIDLLFKFGINTMSFNGSKTFVKYIIFEKINSTLKMYE